MSGLFGALDTATSGARVADTWMSTIADNIANADSVRPAGVDPYRAKFVIPKTNSDGSVSVGAVIEQPGEPDRQYDPGNPMADTDGYVTRPVVDMTEQMTNSMVAQRLFQANLSIHSSVRDAYRSALQIGKQ